MVLTLRSDCNKMELYFYTVYEKYFKWRIADDEIDVVPAFKFYKICES